MATHDLALSLIVEEDLPKVIATYKDVKSGVESAMTSVDALIKRVRNGDFDVSKGISFLDLKSDLLVNYLTNLTYVIMKKCKVQKLEGDPIVLRLAEIRTVMERIRPIEYKLKYQINKMIKAGLGYASSNDPLSFRANPKDLVKKQGAVDEENEDVDRQNDANSSVYMPPKLAAMHYDGDLTRDERQQKRIEHARKTALSSSIMQDLRTEYSEAPEEIRESFDLYRMKEDRRTRNRINYEEENMIRLRVSKKDEAHSRRIATMSSLSALADFEDISALTGEDGFKDMDIPPAKRPKLKKGKKLKNKKAKKKGFRKSRK